MGSRLRLDLDRPLASVVALTDLAYDIFLELAAIPARSQAQVRFRCLRPGAAGWAVLDSRTLPQDLSNAVAEQTAIIREVIASRECNGRLARPHHD
jgi:hypothetical protein